jgi:stearoyl-CoA desaturase (Delta-9 desaturase)
VVRAPGRPGTTADRKEAATAIMNSFSQAPAAGTGQPRSPETLPINHETRERLIQGFAVGAPFAALIAAGWLAWSGTLHWKDLVVFATLYLLSGFGVTLGFHRLLTHRSFKTTRAIRALLAILGSMAAEGPVIEWVATHRKHHVHSDEPGDPHSPHMTDGGGWLGALRGLGYAHSGWLFRGRDRANPARFARDLLADRDMRVISRLFPLWAVAGLGVAFGFGVALTGTVAGGLTALLWGGGARIFVVHHATFSINSLCHFFGRRPFATGDESRNLAWLAPITFGEAWHNNHHAFPTSARHGLGRWQLDPTAGVIWLLERCNLAWDVVRVAPASQVTKLATPTP